MKIIRKENEMKKYLILILVVFLISGCASNGQLDSTSEFDPVNGVFVTSVTKAGPSQNAWFYFQKIGTHDGFRMDALGKRNDRDFDNDNIKEGRVLAFQVPEGNYELERWEIRMVQLTVVDQNIKPRKISAIPFTVNAGEMTYIGNLHLKTTTSKGLFGRPVASGGYAVISDEKDIDLPILKEKYPKLKDLPINIEVSENSEWGVR